MLEPSQKILDILNQNSADLRPYIKKIEREFSFLDIGKALGIAKSPRVIQVLADMSGRYTIKESVPALIRFLSHDDDGVRAAAADALAKIADVGATPWLKNRLPLERASAVIQNIIVALGSLKDFTSVDALQPFLLSDEAATRGVAAWSLGQIGDPRAVSWLRSAAKKETNAYPRQRMIDALRILEN